MIQGTPPPSTEPDGTSYIRQRVMKGTLWFSLGTAGRAVLRLIVMAILGRLLVPEDFGLVGAAAIFIAFAELFSVSGLALSVVQRRDLEQRHVRTAFTASVMMGTMVGGLFFLLSGLFASLVGMPRLQPVLALLSMLFPLTALAAVSQKLVERELAYGWIATIEVVSYVVGYAAIVIPLAWAGYGLWSLVFAQLGAALVRVIMLVAAQPHSFRPGFDRRSFSELMATGFGFSIARYATFAAQRGDYFVVGRWLGAAQLGLYERAYILMDLSNNLLTNALNTILFPAFSKLQDDRKALTAAYQHASALLALIFLPAGAIASFLAPEIVRVLLGAHWDAAVAPFRILALAMFFRTGMKISNILMFGAGASYRGAMSQAVYALAVIGGALATVHLGIAAVAAAITGALGLAYLFSTRQALRLLGVGWKSLLPGYLPALFVTVAMGGTVAAVTLPLRDRDASPFVILVVAATLAVCVAGAILAFAPHLLGRHAAALLLQLRLKLGRS